MTKRLTPARGIAPRGSAAAEEIEATEPAARAPEDDPGRLSGEQLVHDWEPATDVRAVGGRDMRVTEAKLLAASCGASGAVSTRRLTGDWPALIEMFPALGPVKTITSNDCALLEVEGGFEDVEMSRSSGRSFGRSESRFFFDHWKFGFSVREELERTVRSSVQFFDRFGSSIHRVELVRESHLPDFDLLVSDWIREDSSPSIDLDPALPPTPERADATVDLLGLRRAWTTIPSAASERDSVLRRLQIGELQALRLVGPEVAFPIPRETVREVLVRCRDFTLPLTLIVGNRGMTQQCVSTPRTVHHAASLLTLRGSDCALQVREDQVESAWIVRRPSTRGSSARLELYGHDGRNAVTIFGGPHHDARVAWAILVGCFAAGSDD